VQHDAGTVQQLELLLGHRVPVDHVAPRGGSAAKSGRGHNFRQRFLGQRVAPSQRTYGIFRHVRPPVLRQVRVDGVLDSDQLQPEPETQFLSAT